MISARQIILPTDLLCPVATASQSSLSLPVTFSRPLYAPKANAGPEKNGPKNAVAAPKGGEADSNESPYTKAPKKTSVQGAVSPVQAKDGSEGAKGESAKDHTPTDNIKVEPKKV